jgi:hypothetical protein
MVVLTTGATASATDPLSQGGVVTAVDVRTDGWFGVNFSAPITNLAACATGAGANLVMFGDANSPAGRNVLSAALLGYATGQHAVGISLGGTCGTGPYAIYQKISILQLVP